MGEARGGGLHVCHAVLSLDVGGLERVVVDLAREGRGLGQRVSVLCLDRPGTLAPQVEALGARLLCVDREAGRKGDAANRLRAALRELRPDVLHTHQIGVLYHAGPTARHAGVPLVVHTEHGNHLRRQGAGYLAGLRKAALWWLAARSAARFFCVSEDIAFALGSRRVVPRAKLCVVPNGIDTSKFREPGDSAALRRGLGIPTGVPLVGTVGRLSEVKRQDVLLRGFAQARTRFPDAHLLLVGDGPERGALGALASELGLGACVHFAGYRSDPEHCLQAMDVFALTSRSEGMPLGILEAWAAGRPVVASAVGGVPALVEHGRTGLLFPPGDVDALAAALCRLLGDRRFGRGLGEAGQEEVGTRYDLHRMAEDYQRHYLALLCRKGGPAACASSR